MKKAKLFSDFLSATENPFSKVAVLFIFKESAVLSPFINTPSFFPRR